MSEMISVIEHQQQTQQHQPQQQPQQLRDFSGNAAESSSTEKPIRCRDCDVHFDSISSLDVHLRYHHPSLMNDWNAQCRENNNNNSNSNNNIDNADSANTNNNSSSNDKSGGSSGKHNEQKQSSTGEHVQTGPLAATMHQAQLQPQYPVGTYGDAPYFVSNEYPQSSHSFTTEEHQQQQESRALLQQQTAERSRFCPYKLPGHSRGSSMKEASPSDRTHCEKCGLACEDAAQLVDHLRLCHNEISPASSHYPLHSPTQMPTGSTQQQQQQPAQPQSQSHYQQLAADNQQLQAQAQQSQQQMHASPTEAQLKQQSQSQSQQQQHMTGHQLYDFGNIICKTEKEPEEHTEILDLDSHKVQTHKYDDEYFRNHQQQQQQQSEMHAHLQKHTVPQPQNQQHQQPHHPYQQVHTSRPGQPMNWTMVQPQDYQGQMLMGNVSPFQEPPNQFIRGHPPIPPVESRMHATSPLIARPQQIITHPMPSHIMTQNSKSPLSSNQSWKSNEARRPKTYNCTACNKWFTSSGHLKRHYNTTLHKNAVKQSNMPDPATLPISAHHHPNRGDSASSRRANGNRISPDQTSSSSPPNLMAGPSGEAPRGLPHSPITSMATLSSHNANSNSSSNSSDPIMVQATSTQSALQQQQHHQQQILGQQTQPKQHQHTQVMLASQLLLTHSPTMSPIEQMQQQQHQQHQHLSHQHQMGSLSLQPTQQFHHPSIGLNSPTELSTHQPMTSSMSPTQQIHTNSTMPMALGSHHHQQHYNHHHHHLQHIQHSLQQPQQQQHQQQPMSSPSPTILGMMPAAMTSSSPDATMEGTIIPQQAYPNALSPHVIPTTIKIPEQPVCIINPPTTTGNFDKEYMNNKSQKDHLRMLPGFCTINQQSLALRIYNTSDADTNNFSLCQSFVQAVNVGGNRPEESAPLLRESGESPASNCENVYQSSLVSYEQVNMDESIGMQVVLTELKTPQKLEEQHQQWDESGKQSLEVACDEKISKDNKIDSESISNEKSNVKNKKKTAKPKTSGNSSTVNAKNYKFENGKVQCTLCDKNFYKLCYLTQHNRSFHEGARPYKCGKCGKRFLSKEKHEKHELTHLGDKPHKCEVCPKGFSHKTDLRRHMCIHTGITPFNCSLCKKKFTRKDHMEKHFAGHSKKTIPKNNIYCSSKVKNNKKSQKSENNNNSLKNEDLNRNDDQGLDICDSNKSVVVKIEQSA